MRYFLFFILFLVGTSFAATVYTQTDTNQNITYSDTPLQNSQKIEVPNPINSTPAQINPPSAPAEKPSTTQPTTTTEATTNQPTTPPAPPLPTRKPYTNFVISSPKDETTFQNQRNIPIEVKVEPALQEGDQFMLYVDGSPYGEATTSAGNLALNQLERGKHQVYAAILDSNKNFFIKSNTITLYIMYAHIALISSYFAS